VAAIAREVFGDTPISVSSDVVPEMQEYERTETTVVNSYVRPEVSRYVTNLQRRRLRSAWARIRSCPSCAPTAAWPRLAPPASRR
jgi:N-methylhydantoinase A/oxoprolinase/acetone carboxylase beta subunit